VAKASKPVIAPGIADSKGAGAQYKTLAVLACAAMLAGCAHSGNEMTPRTPSAVAPTQALIFAPAGGPAMLGVVETVYANAIKQDIALATEARTPGQNMISVIVFEGKGGDGSDSALVDIPFTQVNLTAEALAAWPNSGMAVSPFYVQNNYGPFGYAVGRPATGDTCLYAWQRIAPGLKPSGAIERGAVVIRLQLCDRNRSEESLLNVMYQLRVNTPVFEPGRAPAQIGRIAMPIRPQGAAGFTPVVKVTPPPAAAPRRTAPAAAVVPVAVSITPPPGAPIVPLPGGSSAGSPTVPMPGQSNSTVLVPPPPGGAGQ